MDSAPSQPVVVRPRTPDDLDACERLAAVVHQADRYPVFMPPEGLGAFLVSADAVGTWVATMDDDIVGHVALHRHASTAVMDLLTAVTGADHAGIGVVARLLVSPAARRMGIGRALLDAARTEALRRGLLPALDVVTEHRDAIALYEAAGWTRLGVVTSQFSVAAVDEYVYVAPPR
jgi:GNAT superfamily N-acetyltransferase